MSYHTLTFNDEAFTCSTELKSIFKKAVNTLEGIMSKHLKLAALGTLSLVLAVQAQGAEEKKGLMIGGSFEGGYAHSWGEGAIKKGSQFFIDDLNTKFNVNVSDKVKVVIDEHFAGASTGNPSTATNWNSSNQTFNKMQLGATNSPLTMSAQAAYVEHKCSDHMTTQFGYVRTPFGMENMWSRYDNKTYYYASGFATQHAYGWDADLGIKSTFSGMGNLEVALLEGRGNTQATAHSNMPAVAARWSTDHKAGGMNITPVISAYTGRWRGGPLDLGVSAGASMKMGTIGINAEYLYSAMSPADATNDKIKGHNVWVEPSIDLGVINASAKVDYVNGKIGSNDSTSNWNLSAAVTRDWDKLRIRGAFTTRNLKQGTREHDFRVMFGTKF
jgi:hypothetical protein